MSRRRRGRAINGILLLDKPAGVTSNLALQKARRAFNARKAGHTGTLDPFATGMLPLCFGEASKTAAFMLDARKCYVATARLGQATDTGDLDGEVTETRPAPTLEISAIETALAGFRGDIEQVPPMYSALKHQGKRLYELAREGKTVERKPRPVFIHRLQLVAWESPDLIFEVECSKGTYVRTLAEDIALALDSCAHLVALRRLWVEPFESSQMVSLDQLDELEDETGQDELLLPADAGLPHWPVVTVDAGSAVRFANGNPVAHESAADGPVRTYSEDGVLLGLGELSGGELRPRRVFVREPV